MTACERAAIRRCGCAAAARARARCATRSPRSSRTRARGARRRPRLHDVSRRDRDDRRQLVAPADREPPARAATTASAFATTASCTRCHGPPPRVRVVRPDARFSHAAHAALVGIGRARGATRSTEGRADRAGPRRVRRCHADDFGARRPMICGACHIATEPWRHCSPIAPPPDTPSSARAHHGRMRARARAATRCAADRQLRPPRGHASWPARMSRGATASRAAARRLPGCHVLGSPPHALRTRGRSVVGATRVQSRLHRRRPCASCHTRSAADVIDAGRRPRSRRARPVTTADLVQAHRYDVPRCHAGARVEPCRAGNAPT